MTTENPRPDQLGTGGPPRAPRHRVGAADVHRLERMTRALRDRDYAAGGGACREAVLAELAWAHELLALSAPDPRRQRLLTAVADLHNLAGWTAFDLGLAHEADIQYRAALELAAQAGAPALEANIHYRRGRMSLHHNASAAGLGHFARSRQAARRAGSAHAAAIASANEAWALAMRGDHAGAVRALGRAEEEFARSGDEHVPSWAAFFTGTDLFAMIGTVYTELAARVDPGCAHHGIAALTTAVHRYRPDMRRSRVLCQAMLAFDHMLDDDLEHAAHIARRALDDAEGLTSTRIAARLQPLRDQLRRHAGDRRLSGLADRIDRLAGTSGNTGGTTPRDPS